MEVARLFRTIKDLGRANSTREELRDYCKNNIEEIICHLPRRILDGDGSELLDFILNGIPEHTVSSCKNKVKVINTVLDVMRKESTSLTHSGLVITRLCLDLSRMPAEDLVRWSSDCIQSIVEDKDVNSIWKDILPECLSGLSSHQQVRHCGTDMSPAEFQEQCIRTLCQCRWKESQLVPLSTMFIDIQLSRPDHRQVVNKLCSYIIDVPPETLPPLVHQLVKLCKQYDVEVVLSNLTQYFNVRLYSKLEPPPQDSESTTMDIDDIVPYSATELSRCLSTCLYHISQGAVEPEVIRKHLKVWPRTQLLRSPFLLDLALALSEKGSDFRTVCLDVIKTAIEQRVVDAQQSMESAWIRSVLPPDVDVVSVLKVLTTECANHRELTVVGLIRLAFSLLSVSRQKSSAGACWSHGKLILVRLCKSQPETASYTVSQLADRLAGDIGMQEQYADCLYVLCKLTPTPIERCTQIGDLIENCQPTSSDYKGAAAVLEALHPLLNYGTKIRDTMIMVCRKGLYSRDSIHRCLALSGFLTVLRHMKLPKTLSSSQSVCSEQYSAHSYLTQICVDLHATQVGPVTSRVRNESMCMEVVSILRRCLVQDAAVKQLLYSRIYEVLKDKTVLHECILELLYEQVIKYLPEGSTGDAIQLDKCVQIVNVTANLTEPIAYLLYAIAQFLQPTQEEDLEDVLCSQTETGSAHLRNTLQTLLEKMASADELVRIDMEDTGLTDLTPESKAKCHKVQQLLLCYEALIAFVVMTWDTSKDQAPRTLYNLFKAHNQMLEHTKVPSKTGKKPSKSLNETKDSVTKSQKTQKSQKEKGKGPMKFTNMIKDKAGPFKPLSSLWDWRFCLRILELLYSEDLPWCTLEQRNHIRTRRDFHQWTLRRVQSVVSGEQAEKRLLAAYVAKVAALLYQRCVCRFQDMCDFDDQTAQLSLEVFKDCLTLLMSPNYHFKLDSFMPTITGLSENSASASIAAILERVHSALQQLETECNSEEQDAQGKKTAASLIGLATVVLEIPISSCARLTNIISKLEDHVRSSKQDCLGLVGPLLTAGCREHQDASFLDELLAKLSAALGRIDEDDTTADGVSSEHFPYIDERTGHLVVGQVCTHICLRLGHASRLLLRGRLLHAAVKSGALNDHSPQYAELKNLTKNLVIQLCQLTTWTSKLAKLRCTIGVGSERVLSTCVRLYATLASFVKQLDATWVNEIRLERLLKVSGKKLSVICDNLITYLEASQPQQQAANKVLRDTKHIPRLVLEAEQFSKHVILLSNKAKLNLQQYLSLGTARDFRIKAPILQEVLNARDNDNTRDEEDENINEAETEIISPQSSDDEEEQVTSQPKRRRLK